MSNSAGPCVGLGDKDFDCSLYSQEVDFDFFDESSPSTSQSQPKPTKPTDETEPRKEPPKQSEPLPPAIFSTDALLASLSSFNENKSDQEDNTGSENNESSGQGKIDNGCLPRTRLFDISDTSSDEDEESQPHMIANLNATFLQQQNAADDSIDEDNYLTDDSNLSDITEITPISSLACSPMPSPCSPDVQGDDESNVWIDYEEDHESRDSSHMNLELSSCAEPLAPLHLEVVEMGVSPVPPSFLLMESTNNKRSHNESMRNFVHPNVVEPPNLGTIPSVTLSSSSSETGSGSGCFESSSSMSIPSRATTTMSMSGSSSSPKVFGHMRHTSCKTKSKNHSFTKDETRRIERDNQILLKKIMDAQKRKHHHGGSNSTNGSHLRVKQHPAFHARLKQQKRIDYENSILMQKLQNVKPSKEIRVAFPSVSPTGH